MTNPVDGRELTTMFCDRGAADALEWRRYEYYYYIGQSESPMEGGFSLFVVKRSCLADRLAEIELSFAKTRIV